MLSRVLLLLSLICTIPAYASSVIFDFYGDTVVYDYGVERKLLVNSDDDAAYNIVVKPLNTALTRTDNEVSIPLTNVYINNTHEDVYIRFNEYSNLFSNIVMNSVPQIMTAKVRDTGMLPYGTYNLPLEVQATNVDTSAITTTVFNLQFVIPIEQTLSFSDTVPTINVSGENAFTKNKKIPMEIPQVVNIKSNADWVLSVKTDNFGDTIGDYYIRTISASSGINEHLEDRVLLEPSKEIVIAKGKAPASNESLTVEYSVENTTKDFLPAGKYQNRIKYILKDAQ